MNVRETANLLALIATFDNRKVDEATIVAWHEIFRRHRLEDAQAAVVEHFRTKTTYLMPAHLTRMCVDAEDRRRANRTPAEIAAEERGITIAAFQRAAERERPRSIAPVTPIRADG